MNSLSAPADSAAYPSPRVEYRRLAAGQPLPADVLFAVRFGCDAGAPAERVAGVALRPLTGIGLVETWAANGEVRTGVSGRVRFSHDDHFLAGIVEVREQECGGLREAARAAYREIAGFQPSSGFPHLLRTWNYLDAINDGADDAERYRAFCTGRVEGLAGTDGGQHPAATVIGRKAPQGTLQVYWLAGRDHGLAIENPRQVSAFRYPRRYGPTAPTFSRAMLVTPQLMMISGTASIVGHESRHRGDVSAQVEEILANLDCLLSSAHEHAPMIPPAVGARALLKVYLRDANDLPTTERAIRARLPADAPLLILHGDVCRAELLVELDGVVAAETVTPAGRRVPLSTAGIPR